MQINVDGWIDLTKLNALKLGVFKNQCILHFRLHFLPDLPKFELLTFAK